MKKKHLKLYKDFEYRIEHINREIESLEKRLMSIRTGHQVLLSLQRFQRTLRTVNVDKTRQPKYLIKDLKYLRNLFNSERYQLFLSYYQNAVLLENQISKKQSKLNGVAADKVKVVKVKGITTKVLRFKSQYFKSKNNNELKILKRALSDLKYAMNSLEQGKPPDPRREVSRRSYEQRKVNFSEIPSWELQKLMKSGSLEPLEILIQKASQLKSLEKGSEELLSLLSPLSPRENEAFLLHYGEIFPVSEVAKFMRCCPGTVDQLLFRARKKIKKNMLQTRLF